MRLLAIAILAALLSAMCVSIVFTLRSPFPLGAAGDLVRNSSASAGLRWLPVFAANLSAAAVGFVGGALSAGLLALAQAVWCGVSLGRLIGGPDAASRDMGGPGFISVAAAGLLPHGALELPAFVLVWAVSARRGLALAAAFRRGRLRSALQGVRGDLRLLLLTAVPLLLVSAILEDRVNPAFMDRFLLGIGRVPAVGAERRIGPLFACAQAALSPDGDRIAAIDSTGSRLALLDSKSGAVRVLPRSPEGSHLSPSEGSPSWSPDGDKLAVTRDREQTQGGGLLILDLRTGKYRVVRNQPYGECVHAKWSSRSDEVACILIQRDPKGKRPATSNIWVVDLADDRWRPATTFPATNAIPRLGGLAWSPNGHALAFVLKQKGTQPDASSGSSRDRYALCVVDANDSRIREVAPLGTPCPLAWSPDGRRIALVEPAPEAQEDFSLAASLSLVNVTTGARTANLAPSLAGTDPSWSPDGKRLLYVRFDTCIEGGPIP